MKYTWLGHAGIRLEIGDQILLIDPWIGDCPTFPKDRRAEMLEGATAILVTHAHFDHVADVPDLAREMDLPVYGMVELMGFWAENEGLNTTGFNKGGPVHLGDVAVTMVHAVHSSSMPGGDHPRYAGGEAGFMIEAGGRCVYVSGDTDVMADMGIWADLHAPEIGILCAGGHFTMDMRRAAYAAEKLLKLKTVIPVHYGTFPLLAQSAKPLKDALPDIRVLAPEPGETIEL